MGRDRGVDFAAATRRRAAGETTVGEAAAAARRRAPSAPESYTAQESYTAPESYTAQEYRSWASQRHRRSPSAPSRRRSVGPAAAERRRMIPAAAATATRPPADRKTPWLCFRTRSIELKQETQLSLTNRATHLCNAMMQLN